ncbi:hypothetical protein GCM10009634_11870 [Saccharothrix xinjiangensis]
MANGGAPGAGTSSRCIGSAPSRGAWQGVPGNTVVPRIVDGPLRVKVQTNYGEPTLAREASLRNAPTGWPRESS